MAVSEKEKILLVERFLGLWQYKAVDGYCYLEEFGDCGSIWGSRSTAILPRMHIIAVKRAEGTGKKRTQAKMERRAGEVQAGENGKVKGNIVEKSPYSC